MKEREFKKLVFENFVQAKKELIREGYIKRSDNLNFEDVFSETKKRVLEERVKSLQKENQMLKKQLSKKQLRKEAVIGPQGGIGSSGFESALDRGIEAISSGEQPEGGVFEGRRRRY